MASGGKLSLSADSLQMQTTELLSEEEELLIIQRLHKVLRPFLLRRTKDMVLADLPPKRVVDIWVPLSALQEAMYEKTLQCFRSVSGRRAGALMKLRKATNHPYHFFKDAGNNWKKLSPTNLYRLSGKFEFLDRILPVLLRFQHKVIIFSQLVTTLDLIGELADMRGIQFLQLDGGKTLKQRQHAVTTFTRSQEVNVLLVSTRAGGLGLNLQAADTVVMFDSDWNPQVDAQAMGRAHRIGQEREVLIIRLFTPTHLDYGLVAKTSSKLDIEHKVIKAGSFHNHGPAEDDVDTLEQILRESRWRSSKRKQQAVSDEEAEKITPLAQISTLIARTPAEKVALEARNTELMPSHRDPSKRCTPTAVLEEGGRLISKSQLPKAGAATKKEKQEAPAQQLAQAERGQKRKRGGRSASSAGAKGSAQATQRPVKRAR
mmetsp:Transcript_18313/g.42869  ORF Transcript_18313/g.42869 Transcript_18313/m.42869 type:complete len:431 (-) Transcript_18313:14-1306(-)